MDKKFWLGLLGGMITGAVIVLGTLFLAPSIGPTSLGVLQAPVGQGGRITTGSGAAVYQPEAIPTSEKDLCKVLTLEEINSALPSINLIKFESPPSSYTGVEGPASSLGQCSYFNDRGNIPVMNFSNSPYTLETNKELQKKAGALIKKLDDAGDEAFFVNMQIIDRPALSIIFFRIGEFVYTISGEGVTGRQLKTLTNLAVNKLR